MSIKNQVFLECDGIRIPFRKRWSKVSVEGYDPVVSSHTEEEVYRAVINDVIDSLADDLPQVVSKLVEAMRRRDANKDNVYRRPECIFNYCLNPDKCKSEDRCVNVINQGSN